MIDYKIPKSTEDWDSFLRIKYGYGIYEFSFSIADMIVLRNAKFNYSPQTKLPEKLISGRNVYFRDEIKMRQNLKSHIIMRLFNYLKGVGWWDEFKEPTKRIIDEVIEIYDLGPFFKKLEGEIEWYKDSRDIWGREGRPPEIRNFIASIWAQIIRNKKGANWSEIEQLFIWFYHKLKKTTYCGLLGTDRAHRSDFDRFNLRNAYFRMKKEKRKRDFIDYHRDKYFSIPRQNPELSIEFEKKHIDLIPRETGGLLLKFPEGDAYRADY